MWMDGALMDAPFSSLHVLRLTKVVNSSWLFFSFPQPRLVFFGEFFSLNPHVCPSFTYLPTFKLLLMHSCLLPPPSAYLLAHLSIHLFTYSPIYLPSHQPTYLCTYALNFHQGNDDVGQWRYCDILGRLLHSPFDLFPY